jgi:hypothetical protein
MIHRHLHCALLAVSLLGATQVAAAGWEILPKWQDPFVGEIVTAATSTNADGFSVTIFRSADKRVRAVYALPGTTFDRLREDGVVLMVRPDGFDVEEVSLDDTKYLAAMAETDRISVRDLLWHGSDPSPTFGTFRNMLDSTQLDARFFLDTGDAIDTSWSLAGAPEVIAEAIDIVVAVDPDLGAYNDMLTEALTQTDLKCRNAGDQMINCNRALTICWGHVVDDSNKPGFDVCMREAGF